MLCNFHFCRHQVAHVINVNYFSLSRGHFCGAINYEESLRAVIAKWHSIITFERDIEKY
jgi:hypothetical protein